MGRVIINPMFSFEFPNLTVEIDDYGKLNFDLDQIQKTIRPGETFDKNWNGSFKIIFTYSEINIPDDHVLALRIQYNNTYKRIARVFEDNNITLEISRDNDWGHIKIWFILMDRKLNIKSISEEIWNIFIDDTHTFAEVNSEYVSFDELVRTKKIDPAYKNLVFDFIIGVKDDPRGRILINSDIEGIQDLFERTRDRKYRRFVRIILHMLALNVWMAIGWVRSTQFTRTSLLETKLDPEDFEDRNISSLEQLHHIINLMGNFGYDEICDKLEDIRGENKELEFNNTFRNIFFNAQEMIELRNEFEELINLLRRR